MYCTLIEKKKMQRSGGSLVSLLSHVALLRREELQGISCLPAQTKSWMVADQGL